MTFAHPSTLRLRQLQHRLFAFGSHLAPRSRQRTQDRLTSVRGLLISAASVRVSLFARLPIQSTSASTLPTTCFQLNGLRVLTVSFGGFSTPVLTTGPPITTSLASAVLSPCAPSPHSIVRHFVNLSLDHAPFDSDGFSTDSELSPRSQLPTGSFGAGAVSTRVSKHEPFESDRCSTDSALPVHILRSKPSLDPSEVFRLQIRPPTSPSISTNQAPTRHFSALIPRSEHSLHPLAVFRFSFQQ